MHKTLKLRLNNYATTPTALVDPENGGPLGDVSVDLARLFHHYYNDTQGCDPPDPDLAHFEHIRLLTLEDEFRVRGDGFGASPEYRKSRSNDLGQALCRWFLHEHLNITYFAHLSYALSDGPPRWFGTRTIKRIAKGDAPDYLCSDETDVYLAEAKGRTRAVSFNSADFREWRKQFTRVAVEDADGNRLSVKGHIVATRFATQEDRATTHSTLFAEDPDSPGDERLREPQEFVNAVKALHYVSIAEKLRQPLLAASLQTGQPLPEILRIQAVSWTLFFGGRQHMNFVGGYWPVGLGADPFTVDANGDIVWRNNALRLDYRAGVFFGVEESVFKRLCAIARQGYQAATELNPLSADALSFYYSGLSLLRDGSIIGPVDFFRPSHPVDL